MHNNQSHNSQSHDSDPIVYKLNRNNVIDEVNDAWIEAATNLRAFTLLPDQVIGQELQQFIADSATYQHFTRILDLTRENKEFEFCYRCDTPNQKRIFKTAVAASWNGAVELSHHLITTQQLDQPYITRDVLPTRKVMRCSNCARLRINTEWVEPEMALSAGLLDQPQTINLSYTICQDCSNNLKRV